jgi:hypothetical protein
MLWRLEWIHVAHQMIQFGVWGCFEYNKTPSGLPHFISFFYDTDYEVGLV